ncbi:hypothetical protein C5167_004411 [Papaver somniferum]|uniref:Uncharacterized protein n=1 Tax=Papaver somniferum TaxID=3469 RepID=A0A4Y7JAL8_PAPSO|nr:hypothetical protein C5167_004411 [Papaver somniferum]
MHLYHLHILHKSPTPPSTSSTLSNNTIIDTSNTTIKMGFQIEFN